MQETRIIGSGKVALLEAENLHAISENTTEITSESTKEKKKKNIKKKKKDQPALFNLEETETVKGKHTIPDVLPITREMLAWAAEKVPGIDLNLETDKFRDYHGSRRTKFSDWSQAWRNWMRNAYQWKQERQPKQAINPSVNRKVVL